MSELNGKILEKVKECLFQALGVEKEEISPESSLTRDLGAESIDFLDIIFRLEQAFNIKLEHPVVFPAALARYPNSIKRRLTQPVAVGVCQEYSI